MNIRKHRNDIIILLLFLSIMGLAKAQNHEFAPIGAIWHYGYNNHWVNGVVRIMSISDTLLDGYHCRKLEKSCHYYDYLYNTYNEYIIGYEYVSQAGDSVLLYRDGYFYTLYNLNAGIGDTWTIPGLAGICEEAYGITHVVGVGNEEINGQTLKYVLVVDDPNSCWGYGNSLMNVTVPDTIKIIENIGPLGSYLLPEQRCLFDYFEGGPLRCYFDDKLGYISYFDNNCDYINEQYQYVNEQNQMDNYSIYPNPVNVGFVLSRPNSTPVSIELFDAFGKRCMILESIATDINFINISNFSSGVYYAVLHNDVYSKVIRIIKL